MSFIYIPFSYLMKFCLLICGNSYFFALFFFALFMQVILVYFTYKRQKSQIAMAKVKPKEIAIREKYKGRTDRVTQQKMNLEIQDMYQKNGYNQLSGCLPLLITLPIILILFAIVRNPIQYSSNLLDKNTDFIIDNSKTAVVYYEEMKNSLIKDSYESESDYNSAVTAIETTLTEFGAKKTDDKSEKGLNVYVFDKQGVYADMNLSKLIVDGRGEVEKLIDEGHLSADFMAKYEALDLEKFGEELPNFSIFGYNLVNEPDFGANAWLLLIPLLVFLTSYFSTKVTRKFSGAATPTDANGNPVGGGLFMEVGMPLISALFAYSMSAAIGVYWIWRTIISMGETILFAKLMPVPAVTEEQIAEARKELKVNQKKKKKIITIEVDEDDDSYADLEVKKSSTGSDSGEGVYRKPRKIEMLTADDDDVPPADDDPGASN